MHSSSMGRQIALGLLLGASTGGAVLYFGWYARHGAASTPRALTRGPDAGAAHDASSPAGGSGCRLTMRSSFHLRATAMIESRGDELPAGTIVEVLERGTLERGISRMFRVRIPATGALGYCFLDEREVDACGPAAPR